MTSSGRRARPAADWWGTRTDSGHPSPHGGQSFRRGGRVRRHVGTHRYAAGRLIGAQAFQAVPRLHAVGGGRRPAAEPRAVRCRPDRQCPRRGGHHRRQDRHGRARASRCRLRRPAHPRRGRGPGRSGPRHHGHLHPRKAFPRHRTRLRRGCRPVLDRTHPRHRGGLGRRPKVALGYLFFGLVCLACSFLPTARTTPDPTPAEPATEPAPADTNS